MLYWEREGERERSDGRRWTCGVRESERKERGGRERERERERVIDGGRAREKERELKISEIVHLLLCFCIMVFVTIWQRYAIQVPFSLLSSRNKCSI